MGLGSRIGMILLNFLVMIPLVIMLLVSAIFSSTIQADLSKLKDQTPGLANAHDYMRSATITLWVLFALSIAGNAFAGAVAAWPYIFAFVMTIFVLINLTMAGFFFYTAAMIRATSDYTSGSEDAKTLFAKAIGVGSAMVLACIFLMIYVIWLIRKYRREGGAEADIGHISELALALETGGATELSGAARAAATYGATFNKNKGNVKDPVVDYLMKQRTLRDKQQGAELARNALIQTLAAQDADTQVAIPPPPGSLVSENWDSATI